MITASDPNGIAYTSVNGVSDSNSAQERDRAHQNSQAGWRTSAHGYLQP